MESLAQIRPARGAAWALGLDSESELRSESGLCLRTDVRQSALPSALPSALQSALQSAEGGVQT